MIEAREQKQVTGLLFQIKSASKEQRMAMSKAADVIA